ncbi:HTH domain-containing protein [Brucella sp. HL-2]|nr:HTH domain-containing protein [Brucella sp. HL-2]MCV9910223.1 HTH domain-containing protein [Brucella sp. HL-2]
MLIGPQLHRRHQIPFHDRVRERRVRLNKLIAIFKLYGFASGNDLAHALNISKKTLREDIISLRDAGHIIKSGRGCGYLYKGGSTGEIKPYRAPEPRNFKAEADKRRQRIADFIEKSRVTTAQHLAASFHKTPRTIYRDIAALKSAGVPIVGESYRGYSIEGNAR